VALVGYERERLDLIRANRNKPRADYLSDRGRLIHGPTPPGGSKPSPRESDLSPEEVEEVLELISTGRKTRTPVVMPERLRARSWKSMEEVILRLEYSLGWEGAGWKVGAASLDVRKAENIPSPSPGRLFVRSIMNSPAEVPSEFFVNYRLCECEFAFQLGQDFPVRDKEYSESDIRAGIEYLAPVIEIGDSVFEDWYSLSGYFGGMYDNAGGAAFVIGNKVKDWMEIDLPNSNLDLYVNDYYIKSGKGFQAMGHPVTSLTWMVNWVRERGRAVYAGEWVSTGTCTGHCFVQVGDLVSVDFADLGLVEARFI
jgi:2-keto-4-pentenoate hydratase